MSVTFTAIRHLNDSVNDFESGSVYNKTGSLLTVKFHNANGILHYKNPDIKVGCVGHSTNMSSSYLNDMKDVLSRMLFGVTFRQGVLNNLEAYEDQPFYHFLNHGDNEGDFDTEHCLIIACDFVDHIEEAMNHGFHDFKEWYACMSAVFCDAALRKGAVKLS